MNGEMEKFIKDLAERVVAGDKAAIRNEHAIRYIGRLMEIVDKEELSKERFMTMLETIRQTLEGQ